MSAVGSDRVVRAPRGTQLSCKGWQQEAALRMLMNNLDPEVAERPQDLVVYGGAGKAARNWQAFDAIVATLRRLGDDETLLVQSGKPVGVFTDPRVGAARAHRQRQPGRRLGQLGRVSPPRRPGADHVRPDDGRLLDLHRHAGHPAGHLPDLRRRRREALRHSDLAGRLVLTAGLGGMGGAQPLAVTMAGGVALCVEVDPVRIARRLETGYVDQSTESLDEALRWAAAACNARKPLSIALLGNAADVYPELVRRGVTPDLVTDQTSAHDTLNGYVPNGMSLAEARELRRSRPRRVHPARGGGDRHPRRGHGRPAEGRLARLRLRQQHPRRGQGRRATPRPSPSRASCRSTSGRCSAAATGPSAGPPCRATRPTSRAPTAPCWRPSPTTRW